MRRDLHVNVVDDARIVRDDVEEVLRLLQRSDNGVVRALQNADDAAFGRTARSLAPSVAFVASDPRHDAIAMHGGAGVLGRDEKVLFARFISVGEKSEAGLVNVKQVR